MSIIVRIILDISIHAPREGSDQGLRRSGYFRPYFNPRSPRGERRRQLHRQSHCNSYFNPRSPRGERREKIEKVSNSQKISIHAPREGSDLGELGDKLVAVVFQSTLPARGATLNITAEFMTADYFNPRSPRGERHTKYETRSARLGISIHAPREGSDMRS